KLNRKSDSWARRLAVVAAASLCTTSVPCNESTAMTPVTMLSKYKTPAIRAVTRGDASAICSVLAAALMLVSNPPTFLLGNPCALLDYALVTHGETTCTAGDARRTTALSVPGLRW